MVWTQTRDYKTLTAELSRDVLWVVLNQPEKANALGPRLVDELGDIYGRPLLQEGVRAVVLSGAGKHFCAGMDLDHLRAMEGAGPEENERDAQALGQVLEAILRQEALTVSAVQGACVGGGCGLATAHDFVLAADNARFQYSEVKLGFIPALVATFLPRRLRGADVRRLLLDPDFVDAETALSLGLADRVFAGEKLLEEARAFVGVILEKVSPQSLARTKKLLLELEGMALSEKLAHAARANAESRLSGDCQRGVSYFLQHKRPPSWR
jgi:methylglutaconyl-CoA hydratase